MHQHEAAAAEVSRTGQRHREREPDRHRGVHCVAALSQDFDADPGRLRFLRSHHAAFGDSGQQARRVRQKNLPAGLRHAGRNALRASGRRRESEDKRSRKA